MSTEVSDGYVFLAPGLRYRLDSVETGGHRIRVQRHVTLFGGWVDVMSDKVPRELSGDSRRIEGWLRVTSPVASLLTFPEHQDPPPPLPPKAVTPKPKKPMKFKKVPGVPK